MSADSIQKTARPEPSDGGAEPVPPRRPAADVPGRPCSMAAALSVVGERWALLAIREITLGNHRFSAIAEGTGAPRDILTSRLRALEAAGVLCRHRYSDHPPRFEYHLTAAGRDLYPVLMTLRNWGDRWLVDEPPVVFEHECGTAVEMVARCPHCDVDVDYADRSALTLRVNAADWYRGKSAGPQAKPGRSEG